MLVEHPSPDRQGKTGFRLCAEVEAETIMGWHGFPSCPTLTICTPIGEIRTEKITTDQGLLEMLEAEEV
jgi:hypothetical protein